MKIVKQLKKSEHCGLVFFDQHSAKTRSLINTIGKYDNESDELMILDDETNISKKFRALLKANVYSQIVPIGSNYYVSFDASENTDTGLQESNQSVNEMISFKSMINGINQTNPVKSISKKDNIAHPEPEPTTKVNKPFPEPVVSNSQSDVRQPIVKNEPELDYTKHEKMLTRYDNERREKLITNTLMFINKE